MCSCFFQAFLTSCSGENIELLNDLVRRGGGSGEPVLGDPLGNLDIANPVRKPHLRQNGPHAILRKRPKASMEGISGAILRLCYMTPRKPPQTSMERLSRAPETLYRKSPTRETATATSIQRL